MTAIPRISAFFVLIASAALTLGTAHAQQQLPDEARVVSSVPAPGGGYHVTYEYAGRSYTTRTDAPPGRTIPIQVSPIGVTTSPVYQAELAPNGPAEGRPPWENVAPEPGVVVSGGGPVPGYAPGYAPAPIYAPAPVYVQPGYAYPAPVYFPPIGISLGLGYSRGWGHGHGRWR